MMAQQLPIEPPTPATDAQLKARRRRSVALGLVIGALVVLFYLITVFKMGAAIMNRTL